jgi:hypothetical protein
MGYRISDGDMLLKEGWEAELHEESQEQDVLSGLTGTYSEKTEKVPDSVVMRVMLQPGETARTIPLLLDLNGAGVQGAGVPITDSAESMRTRGFRVTANDVRHLVDNERFGLYAHRNSYLKLLEKANPALAKWLKARIGKHKRQAMVQRISDNLQEAPTSLSVGWNKNILVKNVAYGDQPDYDSTLSDYTSSIITSLIAAGETSAAFADADFFSDLAYWVTNVWKIAPLDNGTYICLVPARQAVYLKRLSSSDGIAGLQRTAFSEALAKMSFQQVLGQIGPLVLVVDDRAPIMVRNTATASLTAYYRDVGDTDGRSAYANTGNNRVYDVMPILGKGAITETIAMKPRYDDDLVDVGRKVLLAMSTTYGYQVTEFDADTATDSTRKAQNCALALFYSGSATA